MLQAADDLQELPPDEKRRYVRATHRYTHHFRAVECMTVAAVVMIRIWQPEESDRAIGRFVPHTVPLVPFPGGHNRRPSSSRR